MRAVGFLRVPLTRELKKFIICSETLFQFIFKTLYTTEPPYGPYSNVVTLINVQTIRVKAPTVALSRRIAILSHAFLRDLQVLVPNLWRLHIGFL